MRRSPRGPQTLIAPWHTTVALVGTEGTINWYLLRTVRLDELTEHRQMRDAAASPARSAWRPASTARPSSRSSLIRRGPPR